MNWKSQNTNKKNKKTSTTIYLSPGVCVLCGSSMRILCFWPIWLSYSQSRESLLDNFFTLKTKKKMSAVITPLFEGIEQEGKWALALPGRIAPPGSTPLIRSQQIFFKLSVDNNKQDWWEWWHLYLVVPRRSWKEAPRMVALTTCRRSHGSGHVPWGGSKARYLIVAWVRRHQCTRGCIPDTLPGEPVPSRGPKAIPRQLLR